MFKDNVLSPARLLIVIFIALIAVTLVYGSDMFNFFKKHPVHMCPEVKGQVLDNGKPVAGLEIKRELVYVPDEKIVKDITETDKHGNFFFPEVSIKSRSPNKLFSQTAGEQIITAKTNDKEYLLWSAAFWSISPIKAYTNKLAELNCDLSDANQRFEFGLDQSRPYVGESICRWKEDYLAF